MADHPHMSSHKSSHKVAAPGVSRIANMDTQSKGNILNLKMPGDKQHRTIARRDNSRALMSIVFLVGVIVVFVVVIVFVAKYG